MLRKVYTSVAYAYVPVISMTAKMHVCGHTLQRSINLYSEKNHTCSASVEVETLAQKFISHLMVFTFLVPGYCVCVSVCVTICVCVCGCV